MPRRRRTVRWMWIVNRTWIGDLPTAVPSSFAFPISLQRSEKMVWRPKSSINMAKHFHISFFFLDVSGLSAGRPSWTRYTARSSVLISDSEKSRSLDILERKGTAKTGGEETAWTSPRSMVQQVPTCNNSVHTRAKTRNETKRKQTRKFATEGNYPISYNMIIVS